MPVVHNPFPQLSRVAVLPFFNLSNEPTVDGVQFAEAYYAELQAVPGFEVIPVGVVEQTIIDSGINTSDPAEIRRLAQQLGADAIVVGAVTDYSPYYPPRCGLRVEWYAANPGFHEIPAGYGLPWGTPEEEYIPQGVVFEAEMALAREQMKTQSPVCPTAPPATMPMNEALPLMPQDQGMPIEPFGSDFDSDYGSTPMKLDDQMDESLPPADYNSPSNGFDIEDDDPDDPLEPPVTERPITVSPTAWRPQQQATYKVPTSEAGDATTTPSAIVTGTENNFVPALPPEWPDPRGFIPPGPSPVRPACVTHDGPVMTHTRIFRGSDPEFTTALKAYFDFRDDARFGGWRAYLERSDDFIRFCCHLHINEMLSARGGATETRVVERWSDSR